MSFSLFFFLVGGGVGEDVFVGAVPLSVGREVGGSVGSGGPFGEKVGAGVGAGVGGSVGSGGPFGEKVGAGVETGVGGSVGSVGRLG